MRRNMDFYVCIPQKHIFTSSLFPECCPLCNENGGNDVFGGTLYTDFGEIIYVPFKERIRAATREEIAAYLNAKEQYELCNDLDKWLKVMDLYSLSYDEHDLLVCMFIMLHDRPDSEEWILERVFHAIVQPSSRTISLALDHYESIRRHMMRAVGKERKTEKKQNIVKVAKDLGKESASYALLHFQRYRMAETPVKSILTMQAIREIDIGAVAENPGYGYRRFICDWEKGDLSLTRKDQ